MEEFKLPEKWCIKVTKDNIEMLAKYRQSIYGNELCEPRGYIYNYYSGDGWTFEKPISYIEITSSFFKKYVLEKEEDKPDAVNHPSHYNRGKIEVIDFIEDQGLGFSLGNAVKYLCRAGAKDPGTEAQDLNKAIWYINRKLKELKS